jgi:hypothetical protein
MNSWVECGYVRGWESQNVHTPYWACQTLSGNYFEHKVVNVILTLGNDSVFRISKVTGVDNAWACTIDGVAANDDEGDHVANSCIGNTFDGYRVGLESNCTSGELGASSNPVNISGMKKSSNGGDTWSFGPSSGYQLVDSAGYARGAWVTEGQSSWNRRNH